MTQQQIDRKADEIRELIQQVKDIMFSVKTNPDKKQRDKLLEAATDKVQEAEDIIQLLLLEKAKINEIQRNLR